MPGYESYETARVLSATPLELVNLLYGGAQEQVARARRCIAAGDIRGRSAAVTKALEIIAELSASLDWERGGSVARDLARLYDYIARLLVDANLRQVEAPLSEAQRLLEVLGAAWSEIARRPAPQPSAAATEPGRSELECERYSFCY